MRLTNAADCGGMDCVIPVGGSSWRNINNHRGHDTMLVFLGLRGAGPALLEYNKVTGKVRRLGPLFDPASPFASSSGDGWYFSATRPHQLYVTGPREATLRRYDVRARTFETVFDARAQFGAATYISEAHSSDDDNVHSASLRDLSSDAKQGCVVYREDSGQYRFYPAAQGFTECEIDASGRGLVIRQDRDQAPGQDDLFVDLETGTERAVTEGTGPVPPSSAGYACAPGTTAAPEPRWSQIACSRRDGSGEVLVIAPSMLAANRPARGGLDGQRPTGNLDVTGRYFIWVSNGGGRADAFLVRVPWQRLTATSPGMLVPPGTLAEPAAGSPTRDVSRQPAAPAAGTTITDPTLLPVATTLQSSLTAAYNLLNIPALAAGSWYLDPTTAVKIYKLTSASYPAANSNWSHDYGEGGDEISLPYNGTTRAVLVHQNSASGGPWWLVDFTPGTGVSNARLLSGNFSPWIGISFSFSNNPATPYYAYVANNGMVRRFDIRTMTEAPGGGWPLTEPGACWMHQSANDSFFTWMRNCGSTIVGYEPATGTLKTYTNAGINEPRIDRAGRYVGLSMDTPVNGLLLWDWVTNSILWSTGGDPSGAPQFSHVASLKDRWLGINWGLSWPGQYSMFTANVPNSAVNIGGPANGSLTYGNGNWVQSPADLNDQWALFSHYGSLEPTGAAWLAPGGMVLITANGQRRLLGHPYNTASVYDYYTFPKFSPDGKYVLFTSDMDGSPRSDLFLAELPQSGTGDTTPPTVSITAPAAGATVSGSAVSVTASASDNVGVVGVQFKLDGTNLGPEDAVTPYTVSWDTTLATNGSHSLTAVARDAAGNATVSAAVSVTVSNVDTVPPVISAVSATGISSLSATIAWTTNELADSQVDYGPTTAYGSSTTLNASLITAHSQGLTGLASGTLYHYRVKSRDAAGNLAVSGDFTFTTLQPNAGLIAYLKLDEGTGTTAADSSGNGNVGTLINGATWTAGTSGTGVGFDGLTSYVDITHAPMLDTFPLTMAIWFKTTTAAGVRGLANKYVASSANGYQIFFNNGNLCAWYYKDAANNVYDNGGCTMSTPGYNDGAWHQAMLVVDGSQGRLYVDGMQKASQAWTGTPGAPTTTQDLQLGHYPGAFGGAEYLPGTIDDFRLYGRALIDAEVLQLYNATRPVPDTTPPVISGVGVTGIGPTSATIGWTTDELADSQVEYGITTSYGSSTVLNTSLVTAHSQALSGLVSATLYHYRVKSKDAAGNLAVSSDGTFVTLDNVAPVISAVAASAITASAATITWTTNEASDSQVDYGLTTSYGSSTVLNTSLVTAHSQALSGLVSATLYHYRVKSRDAAGNLAASGDFTFTTLDNVPPVISAVAASAITTSGATITWTTNEASDSQVEYGLTTSYGASTVLNTSLVTAHSEALSGLVSATLYHYHVKSKDAAGNLAVSSDGTFVTLGNVAPAISAVAASAITTSGATITWTTNEASDSQVEYGITTSYGSSTVLDTSLVTAHSQTLGGLAAATVYHYRVKSRDAAGNLGTSADFTFTTLSANDTSLIVYLKLDEGTGTTAADSSGNGNTGTLMNGPVWTTGVNLGGLSLDGIDDHVRILHAPALDAYPLTVAIWFKTTITTGAAGLVNKYVAGSVNGYQMFFESGRLCAWYFKDNANNIYDGTSCTLATPGFNNGAWHHAAFVVDAAGGRLYVDGVQQASRAWTGVAGATTTTQEIRVGDYPGGGTHLPATVDEVRLYTRALSAAEVSQLYANTKPAKVGRRRHPGEVL